MQTNQTQNIVFKLPNPINFLGVTLVKGEWYCMFLNNSTANIFFMLQDEQGNTQHTGNWSVPTEIVEKWGQDNTPITDAFIAARGWEKAPVKNLI